MKKILFVIAATLLASSCVVKPFQSKSFKQMQLQEQYKEITDTSENIAQIPWREYYQSAELQGLVDTVLAGNFDYKTSLLRIEQSYAMLRSARASIAPSFAAGVSYGGNANLSSGVQFDGDMNGQLSMQWEIDLFGKLYANKEASKAQFWSTEELANATRQALIAATASAYYELIGLDLKENVLRGTIKNREEYVGTTKMLKESGKVNEIAVQQAKAQLSTAQASMVKIRLAIQQAENALALLAGKTQMEIKREAQVENLRKDFAVAVGVPVQLLSYRSDVRASEMNYRQKHYLYMASRAALYPSLSISLDAAVGSILSAHTLILDGLSSLTAPIFQGRRLRAAKESARAEAEIAELAFKKSLFTAVVEVSDSYAGVQASDSTLKYQMTQLDALTKAYQYSDELFKSGYVNYLDVLVAQTSYYDAEIATIDSFIATLNARVQLYKAVGGGSFERSILPQSVNNSDPAVIENK